MLQQLRPRTDRRPLTPTAPGLATVEAVEVFAAGQHRGDPYPVSFLDKVVQNFRRFSGDNGRRLGVKLDPPVVLGHDDEQEILAGSGLPSAGVVWNLWRHGTKLFADLNDVPPPVADWIDRRLYRTVSAEFRENFTDQGRDFGPVFWRLALLGADVPQVKSLADLPQTKRFEDVRRVAEIKTVRRWAERGRVVCFSEVTPMNPDEMKKALKAKLPPDFGKLIDSLDDNQLGLAMSAVLGVGTGNGDPNNPNDPNNQTQMADPGASVPPPSPVLAAGLPGAIAPDPITPLTPQVPGVPPIAAPPSQITMKFADMERQLAAIQVKQLAADKLVSDRLAREDDAQVTRFWDEELTAGRKAPWQQTARVQELKALEAGRTLKFDDAGERPMSPREYSHYVAMKGPPVLKFGEHMTATGPQAAWEDRKRRMMEGNPIGRAILKDMDKAAPAK